ncbi:transposase [Pseudorhodoferax sp.]|uniref:transposase n=1 Tax=Pseudorhodoferax sp. TaxID=1993553 RepID=UPI0039E2B7D5
MEGGDEPVRDPLRRPVHQDRRVGPRPTFPPRRSPRRKRRPPPCKSLSASNTEIRTLPCRVHFMRNALAHAGKTQRRMVSAAIGTVFVQDSADAARTQWRSVAEQLSGKFPKLAALMDEAENDVLAFMTFPRAHWTQIYSTNPLERLNAQIKRRTNVVGIFPNDASIVRLVGAMMLEQNDEWSLNRRYIQLEGLQTLSDTAPTRLSAVAR